MNLFDHLVAEVLRTRAGLALLRPVMEKEFFLSEKIAVASGSFEKQELFLHSIDGNPVRFDMAVP